MADKINIQLNREKHTELVEYFDKFDGKPLQALSNLVEENKKLKAQLSSITNERDDTLDRYTTFLMKELIPIRLALRETEKDLWQLKQVKNTEIKDTLAFEKPIYQSVFYLSENKSEMFSKLEGRWKDYIDEVSARRKDRVAKIIERKAWEDIEEE